MFFFSLRIKGYVSERANILINGCWNQQQLVEAIEGTS